MQKQFEAKHSMASEFSQAICRGRKLALGLGFEALDFRLVCLVSSLCSEHWAGFGF